MRNNSYKVLSIRIEPCQLQLIDISFDGLFNLEISIVVKGAFPLHCVITYLVHASVRRCLPLNDSVSSFY